MDSPRPEGGGNARDLRDELGREQARIRVNVVDRASVDAERRQQSAVVVHAAEIGAHLPVVPKDRASAVPALDRTFEVVPLIDPAKRGLRRLTLIEIV